MTILLVSAVSIRPIKTTLYTVEGETITFPPDDARAKLLALGCRVALQESNLEFVEVDLEHKRLLYTPPQAQPKKGFLGFILGLITGFFATKRAVQFSPIHAAPYGSQDTMLAPIDNLVNHAFEQTERTEAMEAEIPETAIVLRNQNEEVDSSFMDMLDEELDNVPPPEPDDVAYGFTGEVPEEYLTIRSPIQKATVEVKDATQGNSLGGVRSVPVSLAAVPDFEALAREAAIQKVEEAPRGSNRDAIRALYRQWFKDPSDQNLDALLAFKAKKKQTWLRLGLISDEAEALQKAVVSRNAR